MGVATEVRDVLSIGLSVLFPILISIFGVFVGLILIAYVLGCLTGAWLMRTHGRATRELRRHKPFI